MSFWNVLEFRKVLKATSIFKMKVIFIDPNKYL